MEFVRGSVIVPDRVRLSITTISAGLLTKTEAIALLEVMDSGFVDLDLGWRRPEFVRMVCGEISLETPFPG